MHADYQDYKYTELILVLRRKLGARHLTTQENEFFSVNQSKSVSQDKICAVFSDQ